jgi:hypothetical protein
MCSSSGLVGLARCALPHPALCVKYCPPSANPHLKCLLLCSQLQLYLEVALAGHHWFRRQAGVGRGPPLHGVWQHVLLLPARGEHRLGLTEFTPDLHQILIALANPLSSAAFMLHTTSTSEPCLTLLCFPCPAPFAETSLALPVATPAPSTAQLSTTSQAQLTTYVACTCRKHRNMTGCHCHYHTCVVSCKTSLRLTCVTF